MFRLEELHQSATLARTGYEHLLEKQLRPGSYQKQGLLYVSIDKSSETLSQAKYWFDNHWQKLYRMNFDSIKDAADGLKSLQRNWWPLLQENARRGSLIQEALPHVAARPLQFLEKAKDSPLGSYTLLSEHEALLSPQCSSPMPHGLWSFVEDKSGPPNRAYLKLWEVFSRTGQWPHASETVLDLGASPGGWTCVLATQLKCQVLAIDRSPLESAVMELDRVDFQRADGLALRLKDYPQVSWLLSDMACTPEKLLNFIEKEILSSKLSHAVCTIKMQGPEPQIALIDRFQRLPRSQVLWLSANKHELTYLYGF